MARRLRAAPVQFALPLDWTAAGANDPPLLIGPSNAEAIRFLAHSATWPVRTAVLVGPRQSGRSLIGRVFSRSTGGLVIDGVASVTEEAMFHAWNNAQTSGVPLLIIAETPPNMWQTQLPDLASRLRAVSVLRIGEPDDELARDLIEAQFAQRGIALAPGVADYVLRRMNRSYAAIRAVVDALDHAALSQGRRIGKHLAGEVLMAADLISADLIDRVSDDW